MRDNIDNLCFLFENGVSKDEDRELLAQSLFYYCCGADPTPIIAFGSDYPIYIYSDIINYGHGGSFEETTSLLYQRISKAGNRLVETCQLKKERQLCDAKDIVLTKWKDQQKNLDFYLLYVQMEAVKTFDTIYHDLDKGGHGNFIQPKCICNIRYEFMDNYSWSAMNVISKRVEYIMGYCHDDKYKCIAEYDYLGDYGDTTVRLFQRKYWYVH